MKTIIRLKIGSPKINMDLKIKMLHMFTKKRKIKMKIVQIKKKKMLKCKIQAKRYRLLAKLNNYK